MKENFIQFIWDKQLLDTSNLKTTKGEKVKIIHKGIWNKNSGADFSNAKIKIGEIVFFGDVEIHKKSSDWDIHKHSKDKNYNKVILHIVWKNDKDIIQNGLKISTIQIGKLVDKKYIENFKNLLEEKDNLKCRTFINKINLKGGEGIYNFLFNQRICRKYKEVRKILEENKNDWEKVFFIYLCKYFGGKVNKESFENLANSFDFKILNKEIYDLNSLEALLFGQSGILEDEKDDVYYKELQKKYLFLKEKYRLSPLNKEQMKFSKMRPYSFPTIRISQICNLYFNKKSLFSEIVNFKSIKELRKILDARTSPYWNTHFTFEKESKRKNKNELSKNFKDILIINVLIPIVFAYSKLKGNRELESKIFNLSKEISAENNNTIKLFENENVKIDTAFQSQGLIQLKTEFCDKERCLECKILNDYIFVK